MSNPNDYNFNITPQTDYSENYLRFENSDGIQIIDAQVDCDHFGIFGECYPQTQETVQKLCESESDRFYSDISYSHELGQECVDIVLFGLNTIPNVKAWQTPSNSIADVVWKWDVIIEFDNKFYPLQIKSSLDSVEKCQRLLDKNISSKVDKLSDKIDNISCKYDKLIKNVMEKYGYTNHKNAIIFEIKEEMSGKIQLLEKELDIYSDIRPLFLWSSRTEKALQDITRLFSNLVAPTLNPEEILQAAWISYHEIYKTAKEQLLTEQQKKYNLVKSLKACLENLHQTSQQYLETKRDKNLEEQKHINLGVRVEEILLNNLLYDVLKFSVQYENHCKIYLVKIEQYKNPNTFPESLSLILEKAKNHIIKVIKSEQNIYNSQLSLSERIKEAMKQREALSSDNNIFNNSHQQIAKLNEVKQKIEKLDKFNQELQLFKSEEIELIINYINQLLEENSNF